MWNLDRNFPNSAPIPETASRDKPGMSITLIYREFGTSTSLISTDMFKMEWSIVAFARPKASLDGVGVALKVKVRQSNEDIASSRLRRRCFD